jgi:pseudouridine-5'-phosphate glycosidase
MKRKLYVFLLFWTIVTQLTYAQTKTVTGTVKDDSGEILPGVTVIVVGETNGTVTGTDGTFTLSNVLPSTKLKFTFIGMKEQIVQVGTNTSLKITLTTDVSQVDEVVVVGYGTQKKSRYYWFCFDSKNGRNGNCAYSNNCRIGNG